MLAISTAMILALLSVVGIMVTLITILSMNNEIPLQLQKIQNDNKSFVASNVTISGKGQLVTNETSGQIAGVLKGPTSVNLTP